MAWIHQDKILQNEIYEILIAMKRVIKELDELSWHDWQEEFRNTVINDVVRRSSQQIERRIFKAELRAKPPEKKEK